MNPKYNIKENYLLRWRFDFAGGKPSKFGAWSRAGDHESTQAWAQDKKGLTRACVEAKDKRTRRTLILAELSPDQFVNVNWKAMALAPGPAQMKATGPVKSMPTLVGMELVSREFITCVMIDGTVVVVKRPDSDKNIRYEGQGI